MHTHNRKRKRVINTLESRTQSYQGNADHNTVVCTPIKVTVMNKAMTSVGNAVGKSTHYPAGENAEWGSCFGKQPGRFSEG